MEEPLIRVGVVTGEVIRFGLPFDYIINGGRTVRGDYEARLIEDTLSIVNRADSRWKYVCPGNECVFAPARKSGSVFELNDVTIGKNFHWERSRDQKFEGELNIVCEKDTLTAVNILPVEDYLLSVISSEMSAGSSPEFLKAHAVISRGWLLAQIQKAGRCAELQKGNRGGHEVGEVIDETDHIRWYDREDHELFDVCADDHCQRYQGIPGDYPEAVLKAVEETKGMVLMYQNEICDARYSKACGGMTEQFENVWNPVNYPYLCAVKDEHLYAYREEGDIDLALESNADEWIRKRPVAFCNTDDPDILRQVLVDFDRETKDFFRWRVEYTQDELSALIKEKSGIDFGRIKDLSPVKRGTSGRLVRLKIAGTERSLVIGKELEIRRILSPSHLYSAAFVVDRLDINGEIPGRFVLTGAGWGHGVGLCQIGAAVMGAKGISYEEILKHYFRGAYLKKLY